MGQPVSRVVAPTTVIDLTDYVTLDGEVEEVDDEDLVLVRESNSSATVGIRRLDLLRDATTQADRTTQVISGPTSGTVVVDLSSGRDVVINNTGGNTILAFTGYSAGNATRARVHYTPDTNGHTLSIQGATYLGQDLRRTSFPAGVPIHLDLSRSAADPVGSWKVVWLNAPAPQQIERYDIPEVPVDATELDHRWRNDFAYPVVIEEIGIDISSNGTAPTGEALQIDTLNDDALAGSPSPASIHASTSDEVKVDAAGTSGTTTTFDNPVVQPGESLYWVVTTDGTATKAVLWWKFRQLYNSVEEVIEDPPPATVYSTPQIVRWATGARLSGTDWAEVDDPELSGDLYIGVEEFGADVAAYDLFMDPANAAALPSAATQSTDESFVGTFTTGPVDLLGSSNGLAIAWDSRTDPTGNNNASFQTDGDHDFVIRTRYLDGTSDYQEYPFSLANGLSWRFADGGPFISTDDDVDNNPIVENVFVEEATDLIAVAMFRDNTAADHVISSVTRDGQSFSLISGSASTQTIGATTLSVAAYRLNAPNKGTADVVFDTAGTIGFIGAVVIPTVNLDSAAAEDSDVATATSTAPSVSLTVTEGALAVAFLVTDDAAATEDGSHSISAYGSGQTTAFSVSQSGRRRRIVTYKRGSAGATTLTATIDTSTPWVMGGVSLALVGVAPSAPSTPANLVASVAGGDEQVDLTWDANDPVPDRYEYRIGTTSPPVTTPVSAGTAVTVNVKGLTPSTTHYAQVRAVTNGVASAWTTVDGSSTFTPTGSGTPTPAPSGRVPIFLPSDPGGAYATVLRSGMTKGARQVNNRRVVPHGWATGNASRDDAADNIPNFLVNSWGTQPADIVSRWDGNYADGWVHPYRDPTTDDNAMDPDALDEGYFWQGTIPLVHVKLNAKPYNNSGTSRTNNNLKTVISMAEVASGFYNQQYAGAITNLLAHTGGGTGGLSGAQMLRRTIIRLGHEMMGAWYGYFAGKDPDLVITHASTLTQLAASGTYDDETSDILTQMASDGDRWPLYARCWNQAVGAMRAVHDDVIFSMNFPHPGADAELQFEPSGNPNDDLITAWPSVARILSTIDADKLPDVIDLDTYFRSTGRAVGPFTIGDGSYSGAKQALFGSSSADPNTATLTYDFASNYDFTGQEERFDELFTLCAGLDRPMAIGELGFPLNVGNSNMSRDGQLAAGLWYMFNPDSGKIHSCPQGIVYWSYWSPVPRTGYTYQLTETNAPAAFAMLEWLFPKDRLTAPAQSV